MLFKKIDKIILNKKGILIGVLQYAKKFWLVNNIIEHK